MHFSEHLILLTNLTPISTNTFRQFGSQIGLNIQLHSLDSLYWTYILKHFAHEFQSRVHTFFIDLHLRYQLVVVALLPSWNQLLEPWGVRIAINVHKKRRGHEVGRLLCLLIQNIVVGVTHQWSVISVEKHLLRDLFIKRQTFNFSQGQKNNNILPSLPSF